MTILPLGEAATIPAKRTQLTIDNITWQADMTNQLQAGQSVSNPTAKLIDVGTGQTVALGSPPTAVGASVEQLVHGDLLAANHTYLLIFGYQADATTDLSAVLIITCPT